MKMFQYRLFRTAFLLLLVLGIVLSSCRQPTDSNKVRLFVAAGLVEAVDSLTKLYKVGTDVKFEINAASSGTLAKQIEQGAPVDIYFSANTSWMDYLKEKSLLNDTRHKAFAENRLVLITSEFNQLDSSKLADLPQLLTDNKKLALGKPEHVPAGKYAKEALTELNIFDSLQQTIIFTKDVRAALILVEMGEAEYAIVYKTDAISSDKAKILSTIKEELHSKIDLSIGLIETKNRCAKAFYEFVFSPGAKDVFKHLGYKLE